MKMLHGNNLIQNAPEENPVLSIVLITFNQEKYIRKAIEGILCQKTDFRYELIIGEDCSEDRTRDICIEYSQKYPDKIRLLLYDENVGMHQNFLQTLKLVRGKYIAICEGDDYWTDPQKLQMQYGILEKHPDFFGIHTKVSYVDCNNRVIGESDLMPLGFDSVSFDYLVQKNVIHTCSFMFRKTVLDKSVYSIINLAPVPDYALFLVVASKGNICYLNEPTAAYRKNAGITSSWKLKNYLKCRLAVYALLQKYLDVTNHKPAIYATKQFQYFHLFSMPQKGWGSFKKCGYLMPLIWYTILSCLLKPEIRVHEMSIWDVIKLIFKSRFRLKNWRNYLILEEPMEK